MRAAVFRQRLAVLAEIGDVVEAGLEPVVFLLRHRAAACILALTEIQREAHLLLVVDVLVVEDQHRVFVHGGLDLARLIRCERLSQVEARNLADKMLLKLPDGDRHGVSPANRERLVPLCR